MHCLTCFLFAIGLQDDAQDPSSAEVFREEAFIQTVEPLVITIHMNILLLRVIHSFSASLRPTMNR